MPAENRTAPKATIKRASKTARKDMDKLDAQALEKLAQLYRRTSADIAEEIRRHAGADGNLRLAVLRNLLDQVNGQLKLFEQARNDLFGSELLAAAKLGAAPFADAGVNLDINRVAQEAVQFVQSFIAEDGLQLSDRIWRNDRHARDAVSRAIESAVIQGHSASRAAQDFIDRGQTVPPDVAAKIGLSSADGVALATGEVLMKGEGSPYDNALRLFRTELNRAHGEAYRASAFQSPDVVGMRFLLSPNHPKTDICDLHASANLHGLGPGVYPPGESPWPAHPNTLSHEEAVFADEVTPEDKAGKESRTDWLSRQPPGAQIDILGGIKKAQAFRQGALRENQFGTPWKVLKKRFEQRGIEIKDTPRSNVATPAAAPAHTEAAKSQPEAFRPHGTIDAAVRWASNRGISLLPGTAKLEAINSGLLGIVRVLDPFGVVNTEIAFNRRLPARVNAQAGTSYDGSVRFIRFAPGRNKTVAAARQKSVEAHRTFNSRRADEIGRLEALIADPLRPDQVRQQAKRQLEIAKAAERWSVSTDPAVADPIAATASHEAGHTLYYVSRLEAAWIESLKRNSIDAVDIVSVSKYAATNYAELWAEVTSAVHSGLADKLPRKIMRSYQEVLDAIRPVP